MSNQHPSGQNDGAKIGRRNLLKVLGATGLAVSATTSLPGEWAKPVMDLGVLPAHAQASIDLPPVSACIPIPTPADILLTADMSGSMAGDVDSVKSALTTFIGARDLSKDKIGLVSFDTGLLVSQPLTSDVTLLNNKVNQLAAGGTTSIAFGIGAAQNLLEAGPTTQGNQRIIVLFSDGAANSTNVVPSGGAPTPEGAAAAIAEASRVKTAGTRIIAVAVGANTSAAVSLMRQLASSSSDFFYVANLAQLQQALSQGCQP